MNKLYATILQKFGASKYVNCHFRSINIISSFKKKNNKKKILLAPNF